MTKKTLPIKSFFKIFGNSIVIIKLDDSFLGKVFFDDKKFDKCFYIWYNPNKEGNNKNGRERKYNW